MIKGGLSVLLLKSQKGLVPYLQAAQPLVVVERLVISDISGVFSGFSSPAAMGRRRFLNAGGMSTKSSSVKRDMFSAGDIPVLFRGWQTRECVGNLVPRQCKKSHMLPYFARPFAFSSASQSSDQTPSQDDPKEMMECKRKQLIHRERVERYSANLSQYQIPGLLFHSRAENSNIRYVLDYNPEGFCFGDEKDFAAIYNHDHSHENALQVPHAHVCRGSAYGWLFLTDDNLDMKLLNPFSGAEIQLPPVKTLPPSEEEEEEARWPLSKWFVSKAIFSANPSVEPRPVVLVIYGGQRIPRLAFCKPGDQGWTPLEFPIKRHFHWGPVFHRDAIYHNGQFYVLSHPGYVASFDIGRCFNDDDLSVKTTLVATAAKRYRKSLREWHLIMLDGELVRFELRKACFCPSCFHESFAIQCWESRRDGDTSDEDYYTDKEYDVNYADADEDFETEVVDDDDDGKDEDGITYDQFGMRQNKTGECSGIPLIKTYRIKIRRFDEFRKRWVMMKSLGDNAVFIGYNTSFAISGSDYPGFNFFFNCIYFTYGDGGNENTEMVRYDMGCYHVKKKCFSSLYPDIPVSSCGTDDDALQFKVPVPIWIVGSFVDL